MSAHTCGDQRSEPGVFLRHFQPSPFFFWTQNRWVSSILSHWAASLGDHPASTSPTRGLQVHAAMPGFWAWLLEDWARLLLWAQQALY